MKANSPAKKRATFKVNLDLNSIDQKVEIGFDRPSRDPTELAASMSKSAGVIKAFLLVIALTFSAPCAAAEPNWPPPADARGWGCYDAAPGHPTPAEKHAFVGEIAAPAQAVERSGGAPAAGVMAMAALESGFGYTRTAIFANNLFGWKFSSTKVAGSRGSWTLTCQPSRDPGNRYISFIGKGDSVAFVAGRLSKLRRYEPVTRQYHDDRAKGVAVDVAVERWVKGIAAAGYNPYATYPGKVMAIVRNFERPGSPSIPVYSLLTYSDAAGVAAQAAPATAPTLVHAPAGAMSVPSAAAGAASAYLDGHLQKSRYLARNCGDPITTWENYAGRQVRRCTYSVTSAGKTLSAIVYLLNPDEANIVARIGDACAAIGLASHASCGFGLAKLIVGQNGGQFPVAGFVIERKQDAGGVGPDPVYLEFRDGVTVRTAGGLNFTDRQLSDEVMEHAARATVVKAMIYARIANADRAAYHSAGGKIYVGTGPASDKAAKWPAVIRANELAAQDSGHDALLIGVAIAMKAQLSR